MNPSRTLCPNATRFCNSAIQAAFLLFLITGESKAGPLPSIPGYSVELYANVTDPGYLTFDSSGYLYAARDNVGSGGGFLDPVRIHQISPGGTTVSEYGLSAIRDPDVVAVDTFGKISGTSGSVLVGGRGISAILPNQTVTQLISGSNVAGMTFDSVGDLLFTELNSPTVFKANGTGVTPLFSIPSNTRDVKIGSNGNIYTSSADGKLREHSPTGQLLNDSLGSANGIVAVGLGGAFGEDIYTASPNGLQRIDASGNTSQLTPYQFSGIAFDARGAMYLSDFGEDRVLKITPESTPPPSQPQNTSRLQPSTGAKNIVLITHGRTPDGEVPPWVEIMRSKVESELAKKGLIGVGPGKWEVVAYNWEDRSTTDNLFGLSTNARDIGAVEGSVLADRQYDHVHLIAHSAGAGLISSAADTLRKSDVNASVHTTFLDPLSPTFFQSLSYGSASSWSDNYYTVDLIPRTSSSFIHSHNVDITSVVAKPATHGSAIDWYLESIGSTDGYGFAVSREANAVAWPPVSRFPIGQSVILPSTTSVPQTLLQYSFSPIEDFSLIDTAVNGSVNILGKSFQMRTNSPAWLRATVGERAPASFVEFDLEFTSPMTASGVLSVYWNETLIGTFDERYTLGGQHKYRLELPAYNTEHNNMLFRLDAYSDMSSQVEIGSVRTGIVATPEPRSLFLAILGVSIVCVGSLAIGRRNRGTTRG